MNNFVEFMVNLIDRKQVPLLHSTVLILCNEGNRVVGVSYGRYNPDAQHQIIVIPWYLSPLVCGDNPRA